MNDKQSDAELANQPSGIGGCNNARVCIANTVVGAGMLGNGQAEKSKIGIIGKQRLRECVLSIAEYRAAARISPLSCFLLPKLKMV